MNFDSITKQIRTLRTRGAVSEIANDTRLIQPERAWVRMVFATICGLVITLGVGGAVVIRELRHSYAEPVVTPEPVPYNDRVIENTLVSYRKRADAYAELKQGLEVNVPKDAVLLDEETTEGGTDAISETEQSSEVAQTSNDNMNAMLAEEEVNE